MLWRPVTSPGEVVADDDADEMMLPDYLFDRLEEFARLSSRDDEWIRTLQRNGVLLPNGLGLHLGAEHGQGDKKDGKSWAHRSILETGRGIVALLALQTRAAFGSAVPSFRWGSPVASRDPIPRVSFQVAGRNRTRGSPR